MENTALKTLRAEVARLFKEVDELKKRYKRLKRESPYEHEQLDRLRALIHATQLTLTNRRNELESYQLEFLFGA